MRLPVLFAASLMLTAAPALALDSAITLDLGPGDGERTTMRYDCEGLESFDVHYLNVQPNFLAIVPVEGEDLLFVSVLSASGARYASNQYVWWTRGPEASLYDLTQGEDADPIATCMEFTNTP